MTQELKKEICDQIAQIFGGRHKTRESIAWNLMHEHRQHWGLRRTVLENYGDSPKMQYITGQDFTWESKQIRNALKS